MCSCHATILCSHSRALWQARADIQWRTSQVQHSVTSRGPTSCRTGRGAHTCTARLLLQLHRGCPRAQGACAQGDCRHWRLCRPRRQRRQRCSATSCRHTSFTVRQAIAAWQLESRHRPVLAGPGQIPAAVSRQDSSASSVQVLAGLAEVQPPMLH